MKITTATLKKKKQKGEKITMLTAYDYPTALIVDRAGTDMILVGDSLGNVVLGYDNTTKVTMEDMIYHTKMVVRAAAESLVVADLPFLSCSTGVRDAVINAGRLVMEGGASMVKLEGGAEFCEEVRAIVRAAIPVMGHIGLQPQSVHKYGGYFIQGKDDDTAEQILNDAKSLEEAGASALLLECVPASLARRVTDAVSIPTIGIGAGVGCDGQVLVLHDMLGLYHGKTSKFVKKYADLSKIIEDAVSEYNNEVRNSSFPGDEHSF